MAKVPIKKEQVRNIKRAIKRKAGQAALTMLQDLNADLEKFERKIKTKN